ncbi:hypothetical protein WHK35_14190, partial [Staphylococcus aureus]|uniref:hypothetical protein n=1 Tax=Staphylococcus aureus TaxID=1280 RepID=UPI0039BDD40D
HLYWHDLRDVLRGHVIVTATDDEGETVPLTADEVARISIEPGSRVCVGDLPIPTLTVAPETAR